MGSQLAVESELGRGSRFWFSLSFQLQTDAKEHVSDNPVSPGQFHGVSVLVVDDNATARELLVAQLVGWDMRPDDAVDGDHAVGKLQRAAMENRFYRAIIIDSAMPVKDGFALAEYIFTDADAAPPVILLVPPTEQHRLRGRDGRLAATASLEKPVSPVALRYMLMTAFDVQPCDEHEQQEAKPRQDATTRKTVQIPLGPSTNSNVARKINCTALTCKPPLRGSSRQ